MIGIIVLEKPGEFKSMLPSQSTLHDLIHEPIFSGNSHYSVKGQLALGIQMNCLGGIASEPLEREQKHGDRNQQTACPGT
jgi:hypothetical protein